MYDTVEEETEKSLRRMYMVQLTGGTHDDYVQLIHEVLPEPCIEIDCTTLDDYDSFFDALGAQVTTDPANYHSETYHIRAHFAQTAGSLALYNFDEMNDETTKNIAQYIKGLPEDTDISIALTADDTGALTRGNGDLRGRVRTIDLAEYE